MKKKKNNNIWNQVYPMEEIWNTERALAWVITPRLRAFKDLDKHGGPDDFKDLKEWNDTIQKMIDAFELMKDEYHNFDEEQEKTIQEGLDLFHKYYRKLWD